MTQLVPDAIREQLVTRISKEADEANWDHLPQAGKTARLGQWVDDPNIGGLLRPLVGGDGDVRVWIKEVALKTRSRRRQPRADEVIDALFPGVASIESGTVGIKPHHCIILVNDLRRYICWGSDSNARNLFWAAINASHDDPDLSAAVIVFVNYGADMVPAHRRKRFLDLADRCGVQTALLTI